MTFVYPLLLGGLALAGLPVLLHFLVRKKPTTLVFPAYRFLVQKKRSNTRNLRLKHLLLLLLRMALIVLICFALSRPRLFHEAIPGMMSREQPVALALIFDTTPSMAYKSGEQTRLDLAKKRALELLDQLPEDCRVLILDAADPASFGREEWDKSLAKARQRIQGLTIRPESVPVTTALDEALRRFETFDDVEAQRMPRFVCVFSDRTKPSWRGDANAKRGADVHAFYFDVGIDDPVDLAIIHAELGGQQQAFLEGDTIPLRVVVKATGKNSAKENTLFVQIDKEAKEKLTQNFNFDADKPQTLALDIPTAWSLPPGFHQAEVRFATEDDALSFNNKRYLTFKILDKPRVLVLADDLKRTKRFAYALECLNYAVDHKTVADKIDFSAYLAVFVVGVAAPSEKLWLDLETHVKAGRGVCIIPGGDGLQRAAYNSAAAQKVMPGAILGTVESAGSQWNDGAIEWGHPFLILYRRWFIDGNADLIRNPRKAERYWQVEPSDKNGVIVHYEKDPAIVERLSPKQAGKVLLLTTPMDDQPKAWNNYDENLNSFYLALTLSCARYLCTAPEKATLNYQFGQQPTLRNPEPFPKYLLTSGDFSEEIRFDNGVWTADRLPKAGNYTIAGTDPETARTKALHQFSINIAGEESDLSRVSVAEIEAILGKDAVVPLDRKTPIVQALEKSWDEPLELFPWLMIALLFLLAMENLLANKFYRPLASEPEA